MGSIGRTKIVYTMRPACKDLDVLHKMILAGMDMARFNFSGNYPARA